jgi:BASS family bile acid:Na+ symporter
LRLAALGLAVPDLDAARLTFHTRGLDTLNLVLALVMFGIALDLRVDDFRRLLKSPRAAVVGVVAQVVLLPALTFLLALAVRPPPSVALGMLLVAACPGGPMSNFMTHLARGNTELSVALTTATTAAALVTTPLNLAFWAGLHPDAAPLLRSVALDPGDMLRTIGTVIAAPLALGMVIAGAAPRAAAVLRRPLRVLSLVVFATMLVVALRGNFTAVHAHVDVIFAIVVVHNGLAFAAGYAAATVARLAPRDRRAVTIEVGIQNAGLALLITVQFFSGLGGMALVAACWGFWHLVSGFSLVGLWRLRDARAARAAPP